MARETKRLTARGVQTVAAPGLHADGDGLYLRVDHSGAKRWVLLFRWRGKRTEMGLGRLADVPLADARNKAAAARRLLANGRNPIEVRNAERKASERHVPTFGQAADAYIRAHEAGFRNDKHVAQWRMTLSDAYCRTIRSMRVDEITTENVLSVLKPIWLEKAETASRLRGRIERVLDAEATNGHRAGANPARWRGHLANLLPKRQKLQRGHHAAMPYRDVPAFMERLRACQGTGARALEFLVLTVARTGEVMGARSSGEIDPEKEIWTVPANRMKAGREHRVPLTARAAEIAKQFADAATSEWLFPGVKPKRPISNGTMAKALRQAGGEGTVHGLRSAFRDWVNEETNFPGDLAEAALAHIVGDETERAYRRGDALEKRRKLMEAWAANCAGEANDNVVRLKRGGR